MTTPWQQMAEHSPTVLWNDSATEVELSAAIGWGAVGATCNPVIALSALKAEPELWAERIRQYAAAHPTETEDEIGWAMVRQLSVDAAKLLEPAFDRYGGRNGRLSIQTDPRFYRDTERLTEQAVEFSKLARNIIVKIPATAAGIPAIEEAVYRGVNVNATVSFTVAQAVAVGEAVERGLNRREAEGLDISSMGHVCTIMVGRTDDWMKQVIKRDNLAVDPEVCEWAGVAALKRAYEIYQERGFRTRMLSAAFRNHQHWAEFVGGDVVISPPFAWQQKANESGMTGEARMHIPVDSDVLTQLRAIGEEFDKAYEPAGMSASEFDSYGATVRTLRQFLAANNELETFVRDVLLPNPDL